MRTIQSSRALPITKGVTVTIKNRRVTVKGPRGTLERDFTHFPIDIHLSKDGRQVIAELWFGDRKKIATIRTIITHIKNMITGVTKGFLYKMRLVYNHFPISINIEKAGQEVEIRNYIGEKFVRRVTMIADVKASRSSDVKDEIVIQGNDLDAVAQSAANIQQISRVHDKDIRKFLDGVYVSFRGNAVED